jgi:hypothetical protein
LGSEIDESGMGGESSTSDGEEKYIEGFGREKHDGKNAWV